MQSGGHVFALDGGQPVAMVTVDPDHRLPDRDRVQQQLDRAGGALGWGDDQSIPSSSMEEGQGGGVAAPRKWRAQMAPAPSSLPRAFSMSTSIPALPPSRGKGAA